jgi:uroporphyrinogen decarboxylase
MPVISHRQRLEACLSGAALDRLPVALWRHFPVDDQTPEGLAAATVYYQRTFDFDLVKVTPASSFCIKDLGARDEWRGDSEGTRTYTQRVIQNPEDWLKLGSLDPTAGCLGQVLQALNLIIAELGSSTPVIQTVFSPLAQAKNLVGGDQLLVHMRKYPQELHAGLSILAENTLRFIKAAGSTGISGVFYAVQHAQYGLLSEGEFSEFGRAYDLPVLGLAGGFWLNMLHLHGTQVMFEAVCDYPVQIINWHDRDTFPSITQARQLTDKILCGGLQRERTMVLGNPDQIRAEARQAIEASGGKRFILGTGCVTPITAPYGNLLAARGAVEG